MRDKRAEPRAGIMARIEALWVDETGNPRIAPAKLEDKSSGGASICVKNPIDVGSNVIIHWHGGHLSGTVTYCRRGQEYVVGIQRDPAENPEK
jgi:hypothetical protein